MHDKNILKYCALKCALKVLHYVGRDRSLNTQVPLNNEQCFITIFNEQPLTQYIIYIYLISN